MAVATSQRGWTGSIVNIASLAGLVGWANLGAYSMTKGGLVNLTRTLALSQARGLTQKLALSQAPGKSPGLALSLCHGPKGRWS